MAKGYWVTMYEEISNPEGLKAYAALAGPAVASHGGTFIVRGGECIAKEGLAASRTVVVEFPSFEQAQAAYASDKYQAALEVLGDAARRTLRIVEGA